MIKIKLNVLGLSNSQSQSGAYALVFEEENKKRRLPIIVGAFEAQSIALQLEGFKTPRPLTHDLFYNFANHVKVKLIEVLIHKLEEGVFHSLMIFDTGKEKMKIDARTSDAVALALRFKCPIFTYEEILERAGIFVDIDKESQKAKAKTKAKTKVKNDYKNYRADELQEMLVEAIKNEDYEKASLINVEMKKRKK